METAELLEILARGEDGKHQFKANITNAQSLSEELVAFSNLGGGQIFIGVSDDGTISGLSTEDMRRLNQLVANTSKNNVRPQLILQTENILTPNGLVMVITVADGISKPYMDNNGAIWVKSGSDKRKVTAREEIQRMFQSAGLIHGDEIPVHALTIADVDTDYFKGFFEKRFETSVDDQHISLPQILENMNLTKGRILNMSGALLFAKNPSFQLPIFIVKAIAYPGNEIDETTYTDSKDITGKLADIFQQSISFVIGNIGSQQGEQGVNAPGVPEIPMSVLQELIANALIHRDYFVSAPVRIFIFADRIEIISPGHLPNNLTVENIKMGLSNIRNPILASFATYILPYRGLGNGIIRALKAYPDIEFENDREGNMFKVTVNRCAT